MGRPDGKVSRRWGIDGCTQGQESPPARSLKALPTGFPVPTAPSRTARAGIKLLPFHNDAAMGSIVISFAFGSRLVPILTVKWQSVSSWHSGSVRELALLSPARGEAPLATVTGPGRIGFGPMRPGPSGPG